MGALPPLATALDLVLRETALFAAVGYLVLGVSDLLVDLIWWARALWRRLRGRGSGDGTVSSLRPAAVPGALAVFIPAWDEAEVIGPMLRHALAAWKSADVTL